MTPYSPHPARNNARTAKPAMSVALKRGVATDCIVRLIDPDTVEVTQKIPAVEGWAYALGVHPTDGSLLVGGREGQLKRIVLDGPSS